MGSGIVIVRPWILMGGHEFYDKVLAFNLKVYEHKFMNTIEATNRGPNQGHKRKYVEVEGPCHFTRPLFTCVLNNLLNKRQYNFRLSIHSA